jgi:hypothetical protein
VPNLDVSALRVVAYRRSARLRSIAQVSHDRGTREGDRPVGLDIGADCAVLESGCLRSQPKEGGKLHLRLNMPTRPIANKYREGKLQSTLKRELKRT